MSRVLHGHPARIQQGLQGNAVEIPSAILDSWRRSVEVFRLDPFSPASPRILNQRDVLGRQEKMGPLLPLARAGIEHLYTQIRDAGYVILLTDSSGVVVDFLGDMPLQRDWTRYGLCPGAQWTEETMGTNAIGMALCQQQAWTVHHGEHFHYPKEGLTCSASPLFDHEGNVIGVMDATALHSPVDKRSQHLALKLVEATARSIEDAHLLHAFRDHFIVRFGSRKEFMEIGWDAMLAVNESGKILGANMRARRVAMLLAENGMPALVGEPFQAYFGTPFETVLAEAHGGIQHLKLGRADSAADVYLTVRCPVSWHRRPAPVAVPQPLLSSDGNRGAAGATQLFRDVAGDDPHMRRNCEQAMRIMDRDIPILLEGETGTGKELFAQAIHGGSKRANKPFVAINCGAIPESLIESELFGYVSGTFTGASRQGAKGKIALAHGGTLFLDEIGDMPLQLQTRLLRVIAEKEVTPLGAEKAFPVDIRIISATHRSLEKHIAEGLFREDLYYRLKGISLRLSPLRERLDKDSLARALVRRYAPEFGHAHAELLDDAASLIEHYHWPGNIRQLIAVLRTALALSDSGDLAAHDLKGQLGPEPGNILMPSTVMPRDRPNTHDAMSSVPAAEGQPMERLLRALRANRWNVTHAARQLGISRATAYRWIRRYDIASPNQCDAKPPTSQA